MHTHTHTAHAHARAGEWASWLLKEEDSVDLVATCTPPLILFLIFNGCYGALSGILLGYLHLSMHTYVPTYIQTRLLGRAVRHLAWVAFFSLLAFLSSPSAAVIAPGCASCSLAP